MRISTPFLMRNDNLKFILSCYFTQHYLSLIQTYIQTIFNTLDNIKKYPLSRGTLLYNDSSLFVESKKRED